jgi:hypothetical protein
MTVSRLPILVWAALFAAACSSASQPSEDIEVAAAAARKAAQEHGETGFASHAGTTRLPIKPCEISIANRESHGHIANLVLQEASYAIENIAGLSIAEDTNSDLKLLLVRTARVEPTSAIWRQPMSLTHAAGTFYVAYAFIGEDERYIDGDLIGCNREFKRCGERIATATLHLCQSREA